MAQPARVAPMAMAVEVTTLTPRPVERTTEDVATVRSAPIHDDSTAGRGLSHAHRRALRPACRARRSADRSTRAGSRRRALQSADAQLTAVESQIAEQRVELAYTVAAYGKRDGYPAHHRADRIRRSDRARQLARLGPHGDRELRTAAADPVRTVSTVALVFSRRARGAASSPCRCRCSTPRAADRRRQREVELGTVRLRLIEAELDARSERRSAEVAVASTRPGVAHARLAAQQAAEVLTITDVAFRMGATTNVELIDAPRRARRRRYRCRRRRRVRQARLDLLVALGQFPR